MRFLMSLLVLGFLATTVPAHNNGRAFFSTNHGNHGSGARVAFFADPGCNDPGTVVTQRTVVTERAYVPPVAAVNFRIATPNFFGVRFENRGAFFRNDRRDFNRRGFFR